MTFNSNNDNIGAGIAEIYCRPGSELLVTGKHFETIRQAKSMRTSMTDTLLIVNIPYRTHTHMPAVLEALVKIL